MEFYENTFRDRNNGWLWWAIASNTRLEKGPLKDVKLTAKQIRQPRWEIDHYMKRIKALEVTLGEMPGMLQRS